MKSYLAIFFFVLISGQNFEQGIKTFVLVDKTKQAVILMPKAETEPVKMALNDLIGDVKKITGKTLQVIFEQTEGKQAICIQTKQSALWETFQVKTIGPDLYITGSDELGTIYGVYYFIEKYLGIDPMYSWNARQCKRKTVLSWSTIFFQSKQPTFKYRGCFINDEDLLTELFDSQGKRDIDYPFYQQVTSPQLISKVCETALGMRMNLIIPASFIDILNPAEAALIKECVKRGLFVSMHHVEPMGVSAFSYFNYWRDKDGSKPLFSYFSNREKVQEVWRVYAREWTKYPKVIWQIGLRGIGDRPMWLADSTVPQNDADRGRLISEAMQYQMQLISKIDKRPDPPVTTTLWAEGSTLNSEGYLHILEKVTIVFSDNSTGWRFQKNFFETKRNPNNSYGVYYHHQLWGSGPHLVQIVPPSTTQEVLQQAVSKGDTTYCIMNVSNIREFQLGIAASAKMLWDFKNFNIKNFNDQWFTERYGTVSKAAQQAYQTYFKSFALSEKSGTPILMDGQTAGMGNKLLLNLKLQLNDKEKYQIQLKKNKMETQESKWGKSALADMGSGDLSPAQLQEKVGLQKKGLTEAEELASKLQLLLTNEQRSFFETNFISQLKIMTGLTTWLQIIVKANLSVDKGNFYQAGQEMRQALLAFDLIKSGQRLNTASEKWSNWYRGEKKMNLKGKEKLTAEVLKLLNSQK